MARTVADTKRGTQPQPKPHRTVRLTAGHTLLLVPAFLFVLLGEHAWPLLFWPMALGWTFTVLRVRGDDIARVERNARHAAPQPVLGDDTQEMEPVSG